MVIKLSFDNPKPMYEQIEDEIKRAIYSGELEDNEPLPSVRQLSADLQVSQITTKRAYADLEREGFIYTVAGRGTFVKLANIDTLSKNRQQEIMEELESQIKEAYTAKISEEDIVDLVHRIYGGKEDGQ
ncbi:MAG: GntR family transcriptional regulator [Lachnospira sp.]|nr:GntR family transcriptional regulator [Lachnospira sp.]